MSRQGVKEQSLNDEFKDAIKKANHANATTVGIQQILRGIRDRVSPTARNSDPFQEEDLEEGEEAQDQIFRRLVFLYDHI